MSNKLIEKLKVEGQKILKADDHTKYFESNFQELSEIPGFPLLRINQEIKNMEGHLSSDEEHLLFAMHGRSAKFLVLSNKKIKVYKIPETKSFGNEAGGFALDRAKEAVL